MKKVTKIKRICKVCGKNFEILPSTAKAGKGIFCSRSCAMKGNNNPNWVGGKVKRICQICGNEFEVLICRVKEGGGKYCSKKCLGIANGIHLPERIKGDKNPIGKEVLKPSTMRITHLKNILTGARLSLKEIIILVNFVEIMAIN